MTIMVSIICTAYNHAVYVENALKSFVAQKTNFAFEVLVNDDASTDDTAAIIRKYEKEYPDIIKAFYQKDNLFSQGISPFNMLREKAKGKYIATCEGDDYWIDQCKLQKQVDYMEAHPDCTFCFTNAIRKDMKTGQEKTMIAMEHTNPSYQKIQRYDLSNIYKIGFPPTASFLVPASNYEKFNELFYKTHVVGDLKIELFSIALGYACFIDENTTVYNTNIPNSMTTKWKNNTKQCLAERSRKFIELIDDVDAFSNYKYTKQLDNIRIRHYVGILMGASDIHVLDNETLKKVYETFTLLQKLKFHIKLHLSDKSILKIKKIIRKHN